MQIQSEQPPGTWGQHQSPVVDAAASAFAPAHASHSPHLSAPEWAYSERVHAYPLYMSTCSALVELSLRSEILEPVVPDVHFFPLSLCPKF